MPNVDFVLFTCEGREHLATQTIDSFQKFISEADGRVILCADGKIDRKVADRLAPNLVVQNYTRRGYVQNILNALRVIESEFFFWLEDDWELRDPVSLSSLHDVLSAHDDWAQLRLSKNAPLRDSASELEPNLYKSPAGFSANPCLCRTRPIRRLLAEAVNAEESIDDVNDNDLANFESYLVRRLPEEGYTCTVLDPGDSPTVRHKGYLESTKRQWHTFSSVDGDLKPIHQINEKPSLLQRTAMAARLFARFGSLAARQFWDRSAYDLAFRVTAVDKDRL
jgi:hypothetical protein